MWYMSKFGYLPTISGEEKALCGVRTCMVGLEHGSGGGALNRDPLGIFSAWPHPQGHIAFALLSVGFLTKNYQVVNLIKNPTNRSATCSKSKGANYLLWLSRLQMETLKKKKKQPRVFKILYQTGSPDMDSAAPEPSHRQSRCLIYFWDLFKSRTMRELSTYLETPSEG